MQIIRPLIASQHAPDYQQLWRTGGVWRRVINFYTDSGKLLTLHRQGCGISPGGWVLRNEDFRHLTQALHKGALPFGRADGIQLGRLLLSSPLRAVSLRLTTNTNVATLPVDIMARQEKTGLFGSLQQATCLPLRSELTDFVHHFLAALSGKPVDWGSWLGKGPGLTPSQDDMLIGMLLAAWYYALPVNKNAMHFFRATADLRQLTTLVSASYLHYAVQGCFASALLHFTHSLHTSHRIKQTTNSLLALGHTSGADTLLGFWLVQQMVKDRYMKF